ncbi:MULTISPECIES: NAD(P)/FAD-dependent oxidoreductase [unclassified Fusibacter]|uniref:NAD(P)/FAD-dependent oxidoreductase n=1 Tax=unclassified Fusibacter TaxID=2624464 RepID=UPI0010136F9C|nr:MULTISPECIES: hypothetical protein [unclassified Fusibacter]MCK8061556.1 hypothetical protein [Fusibacter sp. A2]NPE23716.1 hypothetical protein [Fusibacter sp. A1]RXV58743.1 hypothetical protein DWB64_18185 [Fusibacter sp. A1]
MLRTNIVMPIDEMIEMLPVRLATKLKVKTDQIKTWKVFKRSIDARKQPIMYNYTIDFEVSDEARLLKTNKSLLKVEYYVFEPVTGVSMEKRPVVIGFGPAGMFASYYLALSGQKPIIIERGEMVDERKKSVESFWEGGPLNPNSNVQFGEGGAGTFSDGKLTTRSKDQRARFIFEKLVELGAPEDILIDQKPHVGTDLLTGIVKNLREEIKTLGGSFYFNETFEKLLIDKDQVKGVVTDKQTIETDHVFLAIGHSARSTVKALYGQGIQMSAKPFAMGLRIEHPRTMIDKCQYGASADNPKLGAAEYSVKAKHEDRSVYSFCMCPGGHVVNASSEPEHLVVNGMSYHKRDAENSNSALLVSITPDDFESDHPLAGFKLQETLESRAYSIGKDNGAPIQTVGDFLNDKMTTNLGNVNPSITPLVHYTNFNDWMPQYICDALKMALPVMGRQVKGFDRADAILTGVETRSSSPVRIVRDEFMCSVSTKGLYPIGEGAGYAGGITSSAVDGLAAVDFLLKKMSV